MSKLEYLSPEGLRVDGRRAGETRFFDARVGLLSKADGSAYFQLGNTRVLAAVYGPREVKFRSQAKHDAVIINCEFVSAPFSTGERRHVSKGSYKSKALAQTVADAFASVVLTQLYPRSQIDIYIHVLQADGGVTPAAINAASMAIIDAGIPLRDYVAACSAGMIDGAPLLDLNFREESAAASAFIPIAITPRNGQMVYIQTDNKLPLQYLEQVLELAESGCRQLASAMEEVTRANMARLAGSRGLLPS